MRVNKLSGFLLIFVLLGQMGCSSMMNMAVSRLTKGMAGVQSETTASLSDVQIGGGIGSNIAPAELGLVDQSMFEGWIPGGDLVALTFTSKKKGGGSFYNIDGTVTIDGKPAEKLMAGMYGAFSTPSPTPRKVEIVTSTGEKSSFTIAPNKKQIKVLSINGQKDNISLDLTKDVVIELDVSQVPKNTMLKVKLAITQIGLKSFVRACYIRSDDKITIPAAVFRNMDFIPGGSSLYNYDKSFLSVAVEDMKKATEVSGLIPSVSYNSTYEDGKFVTVDKDPVLNLGLTAKGEDKLKDGEMSYDFFKPNAFRSRPSEHIAKIGVVSFGISGTTAFKSPTKFYDENGKDLLSTYTASATFPQQSDEIWDSVVERMYPEIMAIVRSEYNGAEVLPPEAVTQTAGYKSIEMYSQDNFNEQEGFSKGYRKLKVLNDAPGTGKMADPLAYLVKSKALGDAKEKIMIESGADAIMTVKLEFDVADTEKLIKFFNILKTHEPELKLSDRDLGVIVPKLTFEIVGKPGVSADSDVNAARETKYVTGTIIGKGIPAKEIGLEASINYEPGFLFNKKPDIYTRKVGQITPERLDQLIRKSDLLTEFAKALKELRAKEKASGDYPIVWNLQK